MASASMSSKPTETPIVDRVDVGHPTGSEPARSGTVVDVTLIEEFLALSPVERLRQNDRVATLAVSLQSAFGVDPKRWLSRDI
jgi:hypothetical protein